VSDWSSDVCSSDLAHVADVGLDLLRLGPNVKSRHRSGAARRRQNPSQHADRGRLARAIRAEEAENLALLHFEADTVYGDEAAEALLQVLYDDGGFVAARVHGSVLPLGGQDRYEDVLQRRLDRADATDGKARADEHSFRLHRSLIRMLCQQVNAVTEQACRGGGELFP